MNKKRMAEHPLFGRDNRRAIRVAQERTLIKREGGFSLWKWALPPRIPPGGGDPIVEYRNNHRAIFVEKLPRSAAVYSVGRGIIGSSAEEKDRKRVDWKLGESYFLPRKAGIACGWVHEKQRVDENDNGDDGGAEKKSIYDGIVGSSSGEAVSIEGDEVRADGGDDVDVVIYVLKVSPDAMTMENVDNLSPWAKSTLDLFRRCLADRESPKKLIDGGANGDAASSEPAVSEDKNCLETKETSEGELLPPMESDDCLAIRKIIQFVEPKDGQAS